MNGSSQTREQLIRKAQSAFDLLGLEPTTDPNSIKKAFKREAFPLHPDRHPAHKKAECETKFKQVCNARDICMEASRIPELIKDLKDPTTRASQENKQAQPSRHHAPNRNQSHQDSMNDEWRTFVNDPSAYFNLFNTSTASIIVIGGITLLSFLLILLATIFFSALAIVVIVITIAVSIFSISVPVLGWIVGALLFLAFGAWLLDFFGEAFESFQERIKSRLVATAYPHKTLLVAWCASNFMSLVAYTADVNFALFVVYFIVNNLCFIAMYDELSALLKRLEKEYDNIRSRQTDTAISIRSQTTFRDFYK